MGSRISWACSIERGDLPIDISWFKDGAPLDVNLGIQVRKIDDYSSYVVINSANSMHSGNYSCMARNSAAKTTFSAQLTVNGKY